MLARTSMSDVWTQAAPSVAADLDYSGFPWWHALLVQPGKEGLAADRLKRANVHAYLPLFTRKMRHRGKAHFHRNFAVIPGMLFVPIEMMAIARRDDVLEWAHVRAFLPTTGGHPARLSKEEIESIRRIEGKLNTPEIPRDSRGDAIKLGDTVRFLDQRHDNVFGLGRVVDVARDNRIGVEVAKLFGRPVKTFVPATEIEVM